MLRGLKEYAYVPWREPPLKLWPPVEITAVVTVTDDGGSSGRLRREFRVLPPGDIRNCLTALAEDEALMTQLFQYRFKTGRGLRGHSFGNLFLTALTDITGDFPLAVKFSSEVLAIAGRIFPSTTSNVQLRAKLADGTIVDGETRISRSRVPIRRVMLVPPDCKPLPETLEAIAQADLICLGPGSLYTSVIPNLLVKGVVQAISQSPAFKAYFVNLMWQPGETIGYTASDHVKALHLHARRRFLDYVIVNTQPISPSLRRRYALRQAQPVENDIEELERLGLKVIARPVLEEGEKVRHNPQAAAAAAVELAYEARRQRLSVPAAAAGHL